MRLQVAAPCPNRHPATPSMLGGSYPEMSFSITIFCSPAEMLLLPEPGVEAKSLVPASCPLPGALSAVCTSLRIRGRGPSLDTMLCKNTARGRCDPLGLPVEAKCAVATVFKTSKEPVRNAGPPSHAGQIWQVWDAVGSPEIANDVFTSSPHISGTGCEAHREKR